jgi:hypothetical protein
MNCELAHERIVSAAYGELADEQIHELDRHLAGCPECSEEREQLLALKVLANALPVAEPDANLIARSRLRLEEALDALPPKRWYERFAERVTNSVARLQAVPIAATLLLLLGGAAGSVGGYKLAQIHSIAQLQAHQTPPPAVPFAVNGGTPAEVASISSIVRQPNSHMVEVSYNEIIPQRIQGSLDDPAIRQLLMLASENSASAGVRDDSVGLLADECRAGHSCRAAGLRDALMVALRYDKNAGVREKALEGLKPYIAEDVQVRDAVLEAIMNDNDPRIRSNAISLLDPVEGDTSVRQVLHSVANTDQNPYIRTVSRQVLSRVPEIQ